MVVSEAVPWLVRRAEGSTKVNEVCVRGSLGSVPRKPGTENWLA